MRWPSVFPNWRRHDPAGDVAADRDPEGAHRLPDGGRVVSDRPKPPGAPPPEGGCPLEDRIHRAATSSRARIAGPQRPPAFALGRTNRSLVEAEDARRPRCT